MLNTTHTRQMTALALTGMADAWEGLWPNRIQLRPLSAMNAGTHAATGKPRPCRQALRQPLRNAKDALSNACNRRRQLRCHSGGLIAVRSLR